MNPGSLSRVVLLTALFLSSATPVWAGGSPRAHDGGFFLRFSAGGGVADTEFDDFEGNNELSGSGADLNFAAGLIVANNLALHGSLFGWLVSDPTYKLNGTEIGELNADLDLSAFGAGATYYFMPVNMYLSGSVGAATMTLDLGDIELETDTGVAVDVTLGKEWWVGGNWGLGAAGSFGWYSVGLGEGSGDESASGMSFMLRFSATMN